MSQFAGEVGGHPAAVALSRVRDFLKDISGTPLWSASDGELTELLGQALAVQSQLAAVVSQVIADVDGRGVAQRVGAPSTAAWLRHRFQLAPGEAKKQVALATGLDRGLDVTRRALAEGAVSAAHAQVIARTVEDLPSDIDRDVRGRAEADLVDLSRRFDPAQVAKLGKRILHLVDPDAADADEARRLAEEENRAWQRRELRFADDGHGRVWLHGRLPVEGAAVVRRALDPLAKPRPSDADLPDHRAPGSRTADARTPGARTADALVELSRRALAAGDLPAQAGETPQLVVTIDVDKLRQQTAAATLDTGQRLPPAAVRRIACDAQIIPAVLGGDSLPLDLGRAVRLFTPAQRRALTLRDKGCAFPGCDRPPAWRQAHHVDHWIDGGGSDINNGVLLCVFHHRVTHAGQWRVRIAEDGLPEFVPPRLIDPLRRPLRNHKRNHG